MVFVEPKDGRGNYYIYPLSDVVGPPPEVVGTYGRVFGW